MSYNTLKALVNSKVYENTEQRITGGDMNDVLQSAIASLGAHYQMGGLVSPTDHITVGDEPVVFIATTPGTYTYFGGIVVADGEVALLVWSGTAWSKQTPDIATGTEVSQLGQQVIYDVTANNDGATFASLSALLSSENLSTLIPAAVRCGGMSIRFVQSSDNKYVQYRLMADDWSADTEDWAIANEGVYVENPEFVEVHTDSEDKILYGVMADGDFYFGAGVPGQIQEEVDGKVDKISGKGLSTNDYDNTAKAIVDTNSLVDSIEYLQVTVDAEDKVLEGITAEGEKKVNIPINMPSIGVKSIENSEWLQVLVDSQGKVLEGIKKNGEKVYGEVLPKFIEKAILQFIRDYPNSHVAFGYEKASKGTVAKTKSWTVFGESCEGARTDYCTAVGYNVLHGNTGIKNIAMGSDNLQWCSGRDNTAVGFHAMFRTVLGSFNSAFGSESQDDNTNGSRNLSVGYGALQRNNEGNDNVAVGNYALNGNADQERYNPDSLRNQNRNVAIGSWSLYRAEKETNDNVAIGYNTLTRNTNYVNDIAIGKGVDCDKNNQTVIGNDETIETIVRGDFIVKGTDGVKRQIIFNQDGTCSWIAIQ